MRTLLLSPWFGPLPAWWDRYERQLPALAEQGFDVRVDRDENEFCDRVRTMLKLEPPPLAGTGKIHDFRPALGFLYADELRGYDFWGHTDLDCVYGRLDRFLTEAVLDAHDVVTNHDRYLSGPFTIYRSWLSPAFAMVRGWQKLMTGPHVGWVENQWTDHIYRQAARGRLGLLSTTWQTWQPDRLSTLRRDADGGLHDADGETMMAHFAWTKEWPEGVR